jgi:hypothetical protein
MTRLRIFLFRLWALFRSRQMDREIDDEITSPLAEATEDYLQQGLSPEDARRAAQRNFGGVPQAKELYRDARSYMWLDIGHPTEQVLTVEGDDGTVSERLRLARDEVSADFFTTVGTPLRRGRFLSIADGPDAARVAIINETMARRSWTRGDSVGKRFKFGPRDSDQPWYTVVGVVADMRLQGQEREPVPQIFVSFARTPPQSADLLIRTSSSDPLAMAGALRAAVRRVEKDAPIYGVAPWNSSSEATSRSVAFRLRC